MARRQEHKEGLRSIGIRCSQYDLLVRLTDHINKLGLVTKEGFNVRVSFGDVTTHAIAKLAEAYKVK